MKPKLEKKNGAYIQYVDLQINYGYKEKAANRSFNIQHDTKVRKKCCRPCLYAIMKQTNQDSLR